MGQIITTAAITAIVTLTVTLIFNAFVNAPKKRQKEIEFIHDDLDAIKAGLQAVLKNELKVRYFKWLDIGYAPEDAKDDLERMYSAYHNLGANGVMDKHRERFLNLPDKPINQ